MNKFAKNIIKPKPEEQCPGHPGLIEHMKPMIFIDKTLYSDSNMWAHAYMIPPLKKRELETFSSHFHTHDADEVHMVYGKEGAAMQKWVLEDETYEIGVPSTVYIPAGVKHKNGWLSVSEPVFVLVAILKGERTLT